MVYSYARSNTMVCYYSYKGLNDTFDKLHIFLNKNSINCSLSHRNYWDTQKTLVDEYNRRY